MRNVIRNILAIVVGVIAGSVVNIALVMLGHTLVAPPAGIDVNDPGSLARGAHLLEARHFVFPLLAHALGTFTGALVAFVLAASHKPRVAYAVGALFLLGGIAAAATLPAPKGFLALDLIAAYLPMAALAILAGRRLTARRSTR